MLQGRTFSYTDTQRYRIGANFAQLPVNRPVSPVANDQQDGYMAYKNPPGCVNYKPNSLDRNNPQEAPMPWLSPLPTGGTGGPPHRPPPTTRQPTHAEPLPHLPPDGKTPAPRPPRPGAPARPRRENGKERTNRSTKESPTPPTTPAGKAIFASEAEKNNMKNRAPPIQLPCPSILRGGISFVTISCIIVL